MREFSFTIEFDPGVDPLADVFIAHPSAFSKAIAISVSSDGLWRVDRLTGPPEALADLREVFTDPDHCNECAGPHPDCDATRRHEVVADHPGGFTAYSHYAEVGYCHSIPYHSMTRLGSGLLYDAQRRGPRYEWWVLARDDDPVGELYDALQRGLPSGVTVSLRQVGAPARWGGHVATLADLPYEQREALEAAVATGYYRTPRDASLADVAAELDVPQSTLRYRLRRAEAWLTTNVVERDAVLDWRRTPAAAD